MAGIAVLIILVALGVASLLGFTPDTRDPEFGLGPLIAGRDKRAGTKSGA